MVAFSTVAQLMYRLSMKDLIHSFLCDEEGMETVEWAVLAALILAATITAVATLGGNIRDAFNVLVDLTTG